jgi:hypothetical protein
MNHLRRKLSLERVGWIYNETKKDVVMSKKHVKMPPAQSQESFQVPHKSGYAIFNFITVILRSDDKNRGG